MVKLKYIRFHICRGTSMLKRKKKAAEGANPKGGKLRKKVVREHRPKGVSVKKQSVRAGILKRNRIAKLEKDLEEERTRNAILVNEMHKMREAKEPAIATGGEEPLSDSAGEILAQSTIEFEAVGPSSTQRPRDITGFEESKFMCSINQLSVSSIAVPECKSTTENGEIDRHTFVQWHDLLVDSMQLAGITDEATKFTIFKVKAGPRLLDIYRNSKADEGAPDAVMAPFGHAMYRLKAYYGSGKSKLSCEKNK